MIKVRPRLHRAIDRSVRWRLGLISPVDGDASPSAPVDPAQFWRDSRVGDPARLSARPLRRPAGLPRTRRAVAARVIELSGPSRGPGDHWGASTMRARLALHPDPDAPVVLILHGYAVPAPWWEEFQMQQLLRRGMSAVRLDLPFHLSRRVPREAPGSGFFSTDLFRTQAVVCQAVEDAAAVVGWLREEIGSPVGVFGVSLGGLVGSLLAANVALQSAVLVIPACDLVDIILELAPARLRRQLDTADGRGGQWAEDAGEARPVLEATLAPITPKLLTPATDPSRIAVVAADHDVIVGARAVQQLAAAWGCECWSYGNGHITVITARGLMPRVHARLESDLLGGAAEDALSALAG